MKTVVITGVSRGIGKALAEKFLAEGCFVTGTSRSGSSELVHDNLIVLPLELSSPESIAACTAAIIQLKKPIDILVNNAGMWHEADKRDISLSVLRETMESNFFGTVDFTERLLKLLVSGAKIINVSSRRGSLAMHVEGQFPSYSLSKAALNMYTRMLSIRLGETAIVSSIHPGSVATDMNPEGKFSPEETAEDIYKLATSNIETGQFWYKGEKMAW